MQIPSKNPMLCGDKQDNTYMKINLIFHKTVTFYKNSDSGILSLKFSCEFQ